MWNRGFSNESDIIGVYLYLHKYSFKREYPVIINNVEYRFDFAVFNRNNLIGFIEYDGKQHFEPIEKFGGKEGLKSTQYRDTLKDRYCTDNKITLLRISYREINCVWQYKNTTFGNQKYNYQYLDIYLIKEFVIL